MQEDSLTSEETIIVSATDVIESAWHGFYICPTWSNCMFLCDVVVRCGIYMKHGRILQLLSVPAHYAPSKPRHSRDSDDNYSDDFLKADYTPPKGKNFQNSDDDRCSGDFLKDKIQIANDLDHTDNDNGSEHSTDEQKEVHENMSHKKLDQSSRKP